MPILLNGDEYTAKKWCTALNAAAIGLSIWMFWPGSGLIPFWIAMLLPFLALLVVRRYSGTITLDTQRGATRPTVAVMFMIPAFLLGARGIIAWHILGWQNIWMPFAVIFALSNVLALALASGVLLQNNKIILCLVVCAAYAFGATLNLNGLLDTSPVTTFHAMVLGKHIVTGKHTSYYLDLAPWGPRTEPQNVDVGSRIYNEYNIGATTTIDTRKGFFAIPYFFVR